MEITLDLIKKVAGSQAKSALAGPFARFITEHGDEFHLDTPLRVAFFIGHCAVESGYFTAVVENLNYSVQGLRRVWPKRFPTNASAQPYAKNARALANNVYGSRMGNRPGTDDGWDFRGRGLKMVTGRENVTEFTKWVKKKVADAPDFTKNPDLLAEMPWAILSAIWFWETKNVWKYADRDDIPGSTQAINGGKIGLEERTLMINKAKKLLIETTPSVIKPKKPKGADEELRQYQMKLNRIAEYKHKPELDVGTADGWHGKKTEEGIKAFQASTGYLKVDGILGDETKLAINNVVAIIDTGRLTTVEEDLQEKVPNVIVDEVPVSIPDRISSVMDKPLIGDKTYGTVAFAGLGYGATFWDKGLIWFQALDPIVQAAIIISIAGTVIFAIMSLRDLWKAKKGYKELKQNVRMAEANTVLEPAGVED